MTRKKARDFLFKLIFELEFAKPEHSATYDNFLLELTEEDEQNDNVLFIKDIYTGVIGNYDEVLSLISNNITGYSQDRVFKLDLAILIFAVYEIKFYKKTPVKIVINEAIELAKKYSTDKSYAFINSALSNIIKEN